MEPYPPPDPELRLRGYRLEGVLARGPRLVTVAATRERDGAAVVLRTPCPGLAPEARAQSDAALAGEREAIGRLGPGVAPALIEEGTLADGRPFLVEERLAGPSLADRARAQPGGLAPEELGRAAVALADALAALHDAGLAHGALEATQVRVESGRARLVGLGSVRRADARGLEGDVRAAGAILRRLLGAPRPGVDHPGAGVASVVARCLADPLRIADGRALRIALGIALAARRAGTTEGSRDTAAPFVGRDRVLAELTADAVSAHAGPRPTFATVTGEPGMGKTRVAQELARRLAVLPGRPEVVALSGGDVFPGEDRTFRTLLAWALGVDAASRPAEPVAALAVRLPGGHARAAAPAALVLGWLAPGDPALEALAGTAAALREVVVQAAGETIRARGGPLCIVLDDAHAAGRDALRVLEAAALAEGEAPIFVCALWGRSPGEAPPSLGERSAARRTLALAPLDAQDAATLCRALLAPAVNVPANAVARLADRSGRIPLLLAELVQGLRAEGLVRRGPGGVSYLATDAIDRVPDLPVLEWLARGELARLTPPLAFHARLLALLGDDVGPEEIAGVSAALPPSLAAAGPGPAEAVTGRLAAAGLVVLAEGRVAFRHPLLRAAIAREAATEERAAIHRAAAGYYRDARELPAGRRLARLAEHEAASGLRAAAGACWLELAEDRCARHAHLEAEGLYSRALEALAPDDRVRHLAALRGRGRARLRVGRIRDAVRDLEVACELAAELRDGDAERDALLELATALDWAGEWDRSADRAEAAAAVAGPAPGPGLRARLALARGRSAVRRGRFAEGRAGLEAALRDAERAGEPEHETRVVALLMLGFVLPYVGAPDDADAALARVLEDCEARGDVLHLAAALNNRRNLWVARGRPDLAIEDLTRSLQIGRELGNVGMEYVREFNLGELRYQLGESAVARAHARRAVDLERRHADLVHRPLARLLLARILIASGEPADARACLDEARAALREPGAEPLFPSDAVLADLVDLATRAASDAEWAALLARSRRDSVEQEPIEVQELRGLSLVRAGRVEEARAAYEAALELAARIPNVLAPRIRAALAELGPR